MITRIKKWGNSQGLRFPLELLRKASIGIGDEVDISEKNGFIIVKPAIRNRGKYKLKDLIAQMPAKGYEANELDWGKPAGKEVW